MNSANEKEENVDAFDESIKEMIEAGKTALPSEVWEFIITSSSNDSCAANEISLVQVYNGCNVPS